MPDLRSTHGEDYYKEIRKKRVTPSEGTIQKLSKTKRKELSKQGHAARWGVKVKGGSRETPITITHKEDGIIVHCDHAGSYIDEVPSDTSDNPTMIKTRVCNKCPAVQDRDGKWEQ